MNNIVPFLSWQMAWKLCVLFLMMHFMNVFEFNTNIDITDWRVVNDGVMGGVSKGQISLNEEGHGLFTGRVSLENNGGFSSVRYQLESLDASDYSKVTLRLKGDGKPYQFRIKADTSQRYSYVGNFETSGKWETITISFSHMHPAFRGRLLDLPNYSGTTITEIAFLIGNKKEETFKLEIDFIKLN